MVEAVCIASGPSLTLADCEAVRDWRDANPHRFVIVVNNTWEMCPWADCLYAMDNEWWRQNQAQFSGEKYSRYGEYGTKKIRHHGHNSGAGAILLADERADKIILLGYDCQHTNGKTHWHGDHKKPLGNTQSMIHWPAHFQDVENQITAHVVNCSRETALKVWKRSTLENELYTTE